jgi:ubiquinone/menaquinone biosynthesis C-methylase UbiE
VHDGTMTDSHHPRGLRPDLVTTFEHVGVASAYQFRPPYPTEVFDILESLLQEQEPTSVLDIGTGEGALARPLIARGRVTRLDAVDSSAAMIDAGRERPGGGHPGLRWIVGALDQVELEGPYCLVTAGASLHWMPWKRTMARLAGVLGDQAVVAVVEHGYHHLPWRDEMTDIIARHSRNPEFDPRFSVVEELTERGLFRKSGEHRTILASFKQPVADYVEQFHSTATLARELMSSEEAEDFDAAVESIVRPYAAQDGDDDILTVDVIASVVWGRPIPRA